MNPVDPTTSVLADPRLVRVLMVTDGEASCDRADFGLATLVDVPATSQVLRTDYRLRALSGALTAGRSA